MFVKGKSKNWLTSIYELIVENNKLQFKVEYVINFQVTEKCNLCRLCINVCPYDCIFVEKNKLNINAKVCIECRLCERICPKQAINVIEVTK